MQNATIYSTINIPDTYILRRCTQNIEKYCPVTPWTKVHFCQDKLQMTIHTNDKQWSSV